MKLLAVFLGVACAGFLTACATEDDIGTRPQRATSSKKGKTAEDDDTAPAATTIATGVAPPVAPIDAGSATTYVGTLDETTTVRFGGSPYCFYDVRLEDVKIEVAALPSGEIIGAQVTDVMIENSVPPCTLGAAPPTDCSFAFTTATPTADGYQLAFNGAKTNHPGTKLVVDLKKAGASYEAAATWHRTDQSAPLDWTIATKITLGPR